MKVSSVSFTKRNNGRPRINSQNTGYYAAAGLGLTIASAFSKNKRFRKSHKALSYITAAIVLIHLLSVEFYKQQYKRALKQSSLYAEPQNTLRRYSIVDY